MAKVHIGDIVCLPWSTGWHEAKDTLWFVQSRRTCSAARKARGGHWFMLFKINKSSPFVFNQGGSFSMLGLGQSRLAERGEMVRLCVNCRKSESDQQGQKCLFGATKFQKLTATLWEEKWQPKLRSE